MEFEEGKGTSPDVDVCTARWTAFTTRDWWRTPHDWSRYKII